MINLFRRFFFLLLAGLAIAACETPVPVQRLPEITFTHLPSLGLNVANIDVVTEYKGPMAAPNVEHLMPTSPETAIKRWIEDRIVAKGVGNVARFTISDGAVTETQLDVETGITGAFKTQQALRYDATVAGMLEIFDERGFRKAFASARVSRSRTLGEDASVNAREQLWFELVEALMRDFNAEMEKNLRAHVGAYVM
ncbi:MAG: hypothetical protein MI741_00395 [Rhodospirillales bacterium]|nr:hypothetical protein [Rhodospirillales bacterium]